MRAPNQTLKKYNQRGHEPVSIWIDEAPPNDYFLLTHHMAIFQIVLTVYLSTFSFHHCYDPHPIFSAMKCSSLKIQESKTCRFSKFHFDLVVSIQEITYKSANKP